MSLSKSFGRIDPFKPENETIAAYLERVDLYFLANDIPDAKKVAILLTSVGDRIYALLRDYFTPNKPADQTYAAIEKALKEHYEPPKIVIAERFHFYQRSQAEGETVAGYVAALRKLASTCDYGDFLEHALRDRLVCGLRNESAQKKLLTEKDLTFVRAVEIAEGIEAAEASTQQFSRSSTTAVHKVESTMPPLWNNQPHSGLLSFQECKLP